MTNDTQAQIRFCLSCTATEGACGTRRCPQSEQFDPPVQKVQAGNRGPYCIIDLNMREMVLDLLRNGVTPREIHEQYGLNEQTVHSWKVRYLKGAIT